MNRGFWATLQKPIFALAPMANVTDAAFRRIINKYGKPDIFWTEFVSVEGLLSAGKERLLPDFWFTKDEHPIVAQIFGGKPEQFYEVAKLIVDLGFDGVDINMGCPDKGIEKSGGGAALIKDPKRAQHIITELKRGIADAGSSIPVSVKTRLGYNKNEIETWVPTLLEMDIVALTMHLRTRKEMSFVDAHWEFAPRLVELRNTYAPQTLVLGNGDIQDLADAREKVKKSGMDGAMLGRAIFGNPWLFREFAEQPRPVEVGGKAGPTIKERLSVCIEHAKLFEELFGEGAASYSVTTSTQNNPSKPRIKPFDVMKKHFKAYVNGFDGARELRAEMMEAQSIGQVESIVHNFTQIIHK